MAIEEVTKRLKIETTTSPVEKAAADINKVAAAEANLAVEAQKAERAQLSLDNAFSKLEKRYVDGVRQQRELADVQRRVNAAVAQNPELQERANAVLGAATQRLNAWKIANDNAANSTKLSRYELINLGRQAQDVVVGLQAGQSPLTVLLQQGTQIADVFAASTGSIRGFFGQVVSGAARFATSAAGVTTGLVAIGGAAAYAALSWKGAQTDVERSLIGIGERSGLTVGRVNQIAESAASTTRLSTSAAREAATEFIKTGKLYEDTITRAVNITDKFALAIGKGSTEAAQELAEILSDVNRGAETLDKRFGFLDGKTKEYLRTLVDQNRQQEAARLLLEKAAPAITKAAEATSIWARGWMAVSKAASEAAEGVGKAIAAGAPRTPTGDTPRAPGGAIAPSAVRAAARGADEATKAIIQYEDALSKAAEDSAAALAAAAARNRQFSQEADNAVKSIIPQIEQVKRLQAALSDLQRAQQDATVRGAMGLGDNLNAATQAVQLQLRILQESVQQEERRVAAVQKTADAYKGVSVAAALIMQTEREQIALAGAVTVGEKLVTQEKITQARLVREQGLTQKEAAAIAKGERLTAEVAISTEIKKQILAMQDQLRIAQARTGQEKLVAQEIATTNQLMREGASSQEAADAAAMQRRITQEQINNSVRDQTRAIQEQIQYLRDVSSMGREAADAAAAYRDAIRQGADHTVAAARAAATLELAMEKVQLAAEEAANSAAQIGLNAAKSAAQAGDLAAKLDLIGTGASGRGFAAGTGFDKPGSVIHTQGSGGTPTGIAAKGLFDSQGGIVNVILQQNKVGTDVISATSNIIKQQADYFSKISNQIAQEQQNAAQAATNAAQAAEDAARAQEAAAEEARRAAEELRQKNNEAFQNFAAAYLIQGMAPLAINALIESGALARFDPSTTFQVQLDLYKRAGVSNARTRADILAGIIGEGVAPTELLQALDALTDAVTSNTTAQLGLSDFYTQQGDRLLGYRGYSVRRGGSSGGSGVISSGGTVGGAEPYGGQVNTYPLGTPIYDPNTGTFTQPSTTGGTGAGTGATGAATGILVRILNGRVVEGYYKLDGSWVTTADRGYYPGITQPKDTYGTPLEQMTGSTPTPRGFPVYNPISTPTSSPAISTGLPLLYGQPTTTSSYNFRQPQYFAGGGVADRPTLGVFGERGPEGIVPLRDGAIPVKLIQPAGARAFGAEQKKEITINGPLITFVAEPSRDEVRETAFQAAQMLRRVMAAA